MALALQVTADVELTGPESGVRFRLSTDPEGHLAYAIAAGGRARLEAAPLGVVVDQQDLGAKAEIGKPTTRRISETFAWRGNKTLGTNQCEAYEIPIRSTATGVDWILEVRVFADGAAFRHRVPGTGIRRINGESTEWRLPAESRVWFQTDTDDYEGVYQQARGNQVPAEETIENQTRPLHVGPPMTLAYPDGQFGLISEASLYRYSGLTLRSEGGGRFRAAFEDDPQGWTHDGPIVSPWRVFLIARDLNELVNSDVIGALCDPPDPTLFPDGPNAAWLKPGKAPCTWMVYGNDGAQWDRQKWFVDRCAEIGCEYLLVDAGWRTERWGWLKDGGDVWARAAELCRYAAERNVGIVLWHAYPEGRDDSPGLTTIEAREELFRRCRQAGVKGVKVDFFNSESKAVIEAYEDLLRRSARYQLTINFHGANKPTGEARTWPHEVTREGIREQEYVLWGELPLAHYGALPFTRMVAGHADFLPGYVQARFLKNTTLMFQMASVVVFSSPFLCWPDNPEAYANSPLLHFVRTVPVTWDETRVLPGSSIGERVIMARRRGAEWFVAVLNCQAQHQDLVLDLSGLDFAGKSLTVYRDGPGRATCQIGTGTSLSDGGKLPVSLGSGGGLVAHLRPPKEYPGWK